MEARAALQMPPVLLLRFNVPAKPAILAALPLENDVMKALFFRIPATLALCLSAGLVSLDASAHGGGAVMDAAGNKASFTALARITCFDDGAGAASYLMARVRDNSAALPGMAVSIQLLKGSIATSVTDTVSGNADYSAYAVLNGGNGVYTLLLNKTLAGARSFDLEWHCMTAGNDHTGTDIIVDQFE